MNAASVRALTNKKGVLACSPVILRTADGREFRIVATKVEHRRIRNDKGVESMAGVPVLTIELEELK